MNKLVVMTGGGTAGHVIPNLALAPQFKSEGWDLQYVGSHGIEKELVREAGISFYEIASGKLRRYFSWQNFTDIVRILVGLCQALILLLKLRPTLVFSKGGYVSVPVCAAAWVLRIPVISHESDLSPGLATKINVRFSARIFFSFLETARFLPQDRSVCIGTPVRTFLTSGDREKGLSLCGFDIDDPRPIVLVMGGSLGAQLLNECVANSIDKLVQDYRVIHLVGKGKGLAGETEASNKGSYKSFEFVKDEIKDIFACTELCVSRSGANSIFELLTLRIPMLLVPLQLGSRGDQVENARSFQKQGWALVDDEQKLLPNGALAAAVAELHRKAGEIRSKQSAYVAKDAAKVVLDTAEGLCR